MDLSIHPFVGRINRDLHDEHSYFNFVKEIKAKSKDHLVYHTYLEYMKTLSSTYSIISNVSKEYEKRRNVLREDSIGNFPIKYEIIKKLSSDVDRKILMAFAFQNDRQIPEEYIDSAKIQVSPKLLSMLKQNKTDEKASILTLIARYDISQKEKDELLRIYENTENKVVFHDFWFTNCGPCMRELPYYNDLMTQAGDDVVFIMFGVYMDDADWTQARNELGLKGRHHLLTKNQLAFFELYFGVHGFPHHQIVNSKGRIVHEQIPDVVPDNLDAINKLITKHKREEEGASL